MCENARKQGFGTRTGSILYASRMGVWRVRVWGKRVWGKNARTPILPYAPCAYEYSGAP